MTYTNTPLIMAENFKEAADYAMIVLYTETFVHVRSVDQILGRRDNILFLTPTWYMVKDSDKILLKAKSQGLRIMELSHD